MLRYSVGAYTYRARLADDTWIGSNKYGGPLIIAGGTAGAIRKSFREACYHAARFQHLSPVELVVEDLWGKEIYRGGAHSRPTSSREKKSWRPNNGGGDGDSSTE